jgi:hypothetical protein
MRILDQLQARHYDSWSVGVGWPHLSLSSVETLDTTLSRTTAIGATSPNDTWSFWQEREPGGLAT